MKQQQLNAVIGHIQRKFGTQAIQAAGTIRAMPATLPTGYLALDDICRIPCGHVSTWVGQPTCGMTTLVLHQVAAVQRQGRNVVYLDSGNTFDGRYAVACGVDLDKLLLIEAPETPLVLDILREVVSSGVVDLLVVNTLALGEIRLDLRPIQAAIHSSICAVVLLARPYLQVNAALRLSVTRQSWLRSGRDVVGCLSSVQVTRNRFGAEGDERLLLLTFGERAGV